LRIPLLAKRPFFDELTVNAAGRVADYKGRTGTVFAWNAGAEWAPVHDLRFRVNQSRAVRAPNLVEIYEPLGQSFVNEGLTEDPCALHNIGSGSSNRAANCRAAGVPADFDFTYFSSFPYLSGGNPDLRAETSDSLTIGAVAQPRLIPGLSLSVDYYDIKVKDVITTPSVQAILNSCYDAASIDNQFCALFQRNLTGSTLPTGEIPGQIIDNSLHLVPLNYAALKVRGIDVEGHYRRNLPGFALLDTRLIYTRALQNDSFLNPEDPHRADQNLLELGNPKDAFNWDLNLKRGPVTFGYRMRYIGKMAPDAIENIVSVQGRPPEDEDAYPIRYFRPAWYHNVRLGFDLARYNFYVGVDNLTNRLPPPSVSGISDQGAIYDVIGRFFYAGAVARF
jgi:outer membrane receptor protein involved in Fe transport